MASLLLGVEGLGGGSQESVLKGVLAQLIQFLDIVAASSVYQIYDQVNPSPQEPRLQAAEQGHLGVVFKARTEAEPLSLIEHFRQVETEHATAPRQKFVKIRLLAYESMALMDPRVTLPDPDLHRLAKLLVPAAEAWPTYKHPILQRELGTLVEGVNRDPWGQFFAQGKALLDY